MIAAGGYFLSQYIMHKNIATLQKQIESQPTADKSTSEDKVSPQAATPTYFVVIAPYGVKFPYSNASGNIIYTADNDKIYFDLEGPVDGAPGASSCSSPNSTSGSLGYLSRATESQPSDQSSLVAHLGDYYYYSKPTCSSEDTPDHENALNDLLAGLKNLQLYTP